VSGNHFYKEALRQQQKPVPASLPSGTLRCAGLAKLSEMYSTSFALLTSLNMTIGRG